MKPVIILIILILALAGIGAIVFVVNRGKCSLPDKNNCPNIGSDALPQVPYCSDKDGTLSCVDSSVVCKLNKPDGSKCNINTLYCDYMKKEWNCTGIPGTKPITSYCSVDDNGLLQYPIYNGNEVASDKSKPDPNANKYMHDTISGRDACTLNLCNSNFKIYTSKDKNGKSVKWCAPDDIDEIPCDKDHNKQSDGDKHDYKDINAKWKNTYILDNYTKYCQFTGCNIGTLTDNKCIVNPTGSCGNLPIGGMEWQTDTSGACTLTGCNNTPGATLNWVLSPNKKECVPKCNDDNGLSIDKRYKYTFDKNTSTCQKSGCVSPVYLYSPNGGPIGLLTYKWNDTTKTCDPDCKDTMTSTYFLLGQSKMSSGVKAVNSTDGSKCIPDPSLKPPWGGCGGETSGYALNKEGDGCLATINSQVAKFNTNTKDGSTAGCIMCQPRICYNWATKDNFNNGGCIGKKEDECNFTGSSLDSEWTGAVDSCVNEKQSDHVLDDSGFDEYSSSLKDGNYVTSGKALRKYKYLVSSQIGNETYYMTLGEDVDIKPGADFSVKMTKTKYYYTYNTFTKQLKSLTNPKLFPIAMNFGDFPVYTYSDKEKKLDHGIDMHLVPNTQNKYYISSADQTNMYYYDDNKFLKSDFNSNDFSVDNNRPNTQFTIEQSFV